MSKSHTGSEKTHEYLERYMEGVKKRNPGEPEFHQAVYEAAATIFPSSINCCIERYKNISLRH